MATRKKRYDRWNSNTKQKSVEAGLSGLFFTCHGDERRALREAYTIIEHFAEGDRPVPAPSRSEETLDTDTDFEKECVSMRGKTNEGGARPKQRPTGVKNCLFVAIQGCDSTKLSLEIVGYCQQDSNCRFLDRVIPVNITLPVDMVKLNDVIFELAKKYLTTEEAAPPTYALEFKVRNNGSVEKGAVLEMLDAAVTAACPSAKVDLKRPKITFFIQAVKTIIMAGVAIDYHARRKYNLHPLEEKKDDQTAQTAEKASMVPDQIPDGGSPSEKRPRLE
ncbi:unnamed protein product, partial [Mesorhabditis spiculigera]